MKRIVEVLLKINYTYPYHQSIGFFLERAGFALSDISLLRDIPMQFDFYLDYAMARPNTTAGGGYTSPRDFNDSQARVTYST